MSLAILVRLARGLGGTIAYWWRRSWLGALNEVESDDFTRPQTNLYGTFWRESSINKLEKLLWQPLGIGACLRSAAPAYGQCSLTFSGFCRFWPGLEHLSMLWSGSLEFTHSNHLKSSKSRKS